MKKKLIHALSPRGKPWHAVHTDTHTYADAGESRIYFIMLKGTSSESILESSNSELRQTRNLVYIPIDKQQVRLSVRNCLEQNTEKIFYQS